MPQRRSRTKGTFTRWVRSTSQDQLMVAAQTKVAKRSGRAARRPEGKDVFWQKVYAPVFYRVPISLRNKVVALMPGSHRKTWHDPAQVTGPAASLTRPWPAPGTGATENSASTTTS